MAKEPTEAQIIKIVRDALKEGVDDTKIVDVQILGRYERDDDTVVRFQVTFSGQPKDWNPTLVASAVRLVRPKLVEVGELAFPLFSFVTVNDARLSASA